MVGGGHDLVTHCDEDDIAGRVVGDDVGVHPLSRVVWIGGEGGDVAVGGADDDSDTGIGKSSDDSGIGAV